MDEAAGRHLCITGKFKAVWNDNANICSCFYSAGCNTAK